MIFFYYLTLIYIYIVQNSQLNNNISHKEKITHKNQSKRNLEEYEPIRIFIDTIQLETEIKSEHLNYIITYMKKGINNACEIISKIIKVKRLANGVDLSDIDEYYYENVMDLIYSSRNESLFNGKNNYDLIIFTKKITMGDANSQIFAKPNIIRCEQNGRPIIGIINFKKEKSEYYICS